MSADIQKKRSEARSWVAAALVFAATLSVVYGEFLFGDRLFLFKDIGSDTVSQFWPHFVDISRHLHRHELMTWSFRQGLGQNLLGYYWDILNFIIYLSPEDLLPHSIIWVECLKSFGVGLVTYALVRKLGGLPQVALIGGLSLMLGTYLVVGGTWYQPSTEALYTVLIVYGAEIVITERKMWLLPLAAGLLFFAQPFCLFHVSLLCIGYTFLRQYLQGNAQLLETLKLWLEVQGLICLGFGLAAASAFEGLALIAQSPRVSGSASLSVKLLDAALKNPVNYPELYTGVMRMLGHDLLGNGSKFSGAYNYLEAPAYFGGLIVLVLAPQVFLVSIKKIVRSAAILGSIIAVFATVPLLRIAFWLFSGDYYRTLSLYSAFGLLVIALVGLDSILRKTHHLSLRLLWLTIACLIAALYLPSPRAGIHVDDAMRKLSLVILIGYGVLLHAWETGKIRFWPIVCLCAVELTGFGFAAVGGRSSMTKSELTKREGYNDYTVDALNFIRSTRTGFYRVSKLYYSSPAYYKGLNDAKIQNYYGSSSYLSFNQNYYIDFLAGVGLLDRSVEAQTRWALGFAGYPLLESFADVRFVLSKQAVNYFSSFGYNLIGTFGDVNVYETDSILPLAALFTQTVSESEYARLPGDAKQLLLFDAAVLKDPGEKLKKFPIVESGIAERPFRISSFKEAVERRKVLGLHVDSFSEKRIQGSISAAEAGLLVFSIPYDRGWRATIDGKDAKVEVADFGLCSVALDPGFHKVELNFSSRLFAIGLATTGASLVIYLLLILRRRASDQVAV